jgi:ligand-binding sensor domain-containing protein
MDDETLGWRSQPLYAAKLPADEIQALAVDADETLWLGTDWGLYQLHSGGTARRFTTQDGLPALQVTHLAPDGRGGTWIGTVGGLCYLEAGRIVPCEGLEVPILSLTVEPGSKVVWVITPDGIQACTPEGLEPIKPHPALPESAYGRAVAVGPTSQRWFGYTEGVTQQFPSRVLLSSDDVDQMTKGENSLCNCVTAIQVDATGRVWVGTPEGLWFHEHNVWRKCQPGIELSTPLLNIQALAFSVPLKRLWAGGCRWKAMDAVTAIVR